MTISEYELNNLMNVAVITLRLVFVVWSIGRNQTMVTMASTQSASLQGSACGGVPSGVQGLCSVKLTTFSHLKETLNNKKIVPLSALFMESIMLQLKQEQTYQSSC